MTLRYIACLYRLLPPCCHFHDISPLLLLLLAAIFDAITMLMPDFDITPLHDAAASVIFSFDYYFHDADISDAAADATLITRYADTPCHTPITP